MPVGWQTILYMGKKITSPLPLRHHITSKNSNNNKNKNNNNNNNNKFPLFTLGSSYSTYASGADQMTETKSLKNN